MSQPYDSSIEAEYADGFILSEAEQNDVSAYSPGHNTFHDILNKLPEADHGKMVRFSVYHNGERHDVDWTQVPETARPHRLKYLERDHNLNGDFASEVRLMKTEFGYQHTTNGKNHKEFKDLT